MGGEEGGGNINSCKIQLLAPAAGTSFHLYKHDFPFPFCSAQPSPAQQAQFMGVLLRLGHWADWAITLGATAGGLVEDRGRGADLVTWDNCQWSQASSVVSRTVAGSCPAPARQYHKQLVTTQLWSCSRVVQGWAAAEPQLGTAGLRPPQQLLRSRRKLEAAVWCWAGRGRQLAAGSCYYDSWRLQLRCLAAPSILRLQYAHPHQQQPGSQTLHVYLGSILPSGRGQFSS